MEYITTPFRDLYLFKPTVLGDARGYFYESFHARDFASATGLNPQFVQDNQSLSKYGVVRGLHMQLGSAAQAKLVRCIQGSIRDVVVDMRRGEATFGQHYIVELSAENHLQLYVPRGFAHGFAVLTDQVVFSYKCDNYYDKENEIGIALNDPSLGIDWKIPADKQILSEKDQKNLSFREAVERYFS